MANANQQNTDAVEAMAPDTRTVSAHGTTYTIRPLEMRQLWPILKLGLPIIEGLAGMVRAPSSRSAATDPVGAGQSPDVPAPLAEAFGEDVAFFIELMAGHGDAISRIVAIALDENIDTVGHFTPDETFLVVRDLIALNRDFFTTRLAPLLGTAASAAGIGSDTTTKADGTTPSSS